MTKVICIDCGSVFFREKGCGARGLITSRCLQVTGIFSCRPRRRIISRFPDVENTQKRGSIVQLKGEFAYVGERIGLSARPYYRLTHVGGSERTTQGSLHYRVPKNETSELGLELAAQF